LFLESSGRRSLHRQSSSARSKCDLLLNPSRQTRRLRKCLE